MFRDLLKSARWIERYENAPFATERRIFLLHLQKQGHSRHRLQQFNRFLLAVAEHVNVGRPEAIGTAGLAEAAEKWARSHCFPDSSAEQRRVARREFVSLAKNWLRFLGKLDEPPVVRPFRTELEMFLRHLGSERGYTDATLLTRRRALELFFAWLSGKGCSLATVSPKEVADYFSHNAVRAWKKATIAVYVQSLRAFFHYADPLGWCMPGIAKTIERPRIYSLAGLPQGPTWKDVQRLIASVSTDRPSHIRDRAIILLLSIYGLRIGEICKLTLDDFDWRAERIRVRRLKRRAVQEYPLIAEVGDSILRYLREVRPSSSHREVFLTLKTPHRPSVMPGLAATITGRIKALGVRLPHSGPHCLRHACATHLLAQGFSLKEIGDHLGHRSSLATQIYAKVDERGLRQVSEMDFSSLIRYVKDAHLEIDPSWATDRVATLREVANVNLGGLQ
jgi:site-specific recombinase XerD